MTETMDQIEQAVAAALETYSNVHRGSGHHALITTHLYERAREILLDHHQLDRDRYAVIFCSPRRAAELREQMAPTAIVRCVSSQDVGLPLGLRALIVERRALPQDAPVHSGGGTARVVAPNWVMWARGEDRFEAGTPAIINAIALAKAVQLSPHAAVTAPLACNDNAVDDLRELHGPVLLARLRQLLVGRGARVPTLDDERPVVNLDNAASTPTFRPIWNAVRFAWRQPRETHAKIIDQARSTCAEVLGAPLDSHEIIFTSNTTEAINLVAESLAHTENAVVLNSFIEHNSNELPWRTRPGVSLIRLNVDAEGFFDLDQLESVLRAYNQEGQHGPARIKLVAVSGASNVLGVFNPLDQVSRIVHRYGAQLLVDAAQLVAHRPIDMQATGIDYLVFSGHKVHAPFGTGVLVARRGLLQFTPVELGQIHGSGEENVGGIAAVGEALALLRGIGWDTIQKEEQALTRYVLTGLAALPRVRVYGIKDPESPRFAHKGGVILFGMKGMLPHRVARSLAEQGGVGVRFGCHCAHLAIKRLLRVPPWAERLQWLMLSVARRMRLPGLVRISLGLQNTELDVDAFIDTLKYMSARPARERLGRRMDDFVRTSSQRVFG